MNRGHSVIFEITPKYCILDSFVDCEGYSISYKGFLPTVVDTIVIWIKLAHSGPFLVHWFLKCQCSLLPSLVWPLPVYVDSWTWHSRFLCSNVFFTASDFPSITTHIHSWALFLLWLCFFILSGAISPLCPTNLGSLSFNVISFCLFILFMRVSRQEYWSHLPFPSPVDHV